MLVMYYDIISYIDVNKAIRLVVVLLLWRTENVDHLGSLHSPPPSNSTSTQQDCSILTRRQSQAIDTHIHTRQSNGCRLIAFWWGCDITLHFLETHTQHTTLIHHRFAIWFAPVLISATQQCSMSYFAIITDVDRGHYQHTHTHTPGLHHNGTLWDCTAHN